MIPKCMNRFLAKIMRAQNGMCSRRNALLCLLAVATLTLALLDGAIAQYTFSRGI